MVEFSQTDTYLQQSDDCQKDPLQNQEVLKDSPAQEHQYLVIFQDLIAVDEKDFINVTLKLA